MADEKEMPDADEFEVVIRHNTRTLESTLLGCDKNPLVALGMLSWATGRVQRGIVQAEVEEALKNAPRIQVVPRVVQ